MFHRTNYHWWSSEDTIYLGSSAQMFEEIRLTDSPLPPTTSNLQIIEQKTSPKIKPVNISISRQLFSQT